MTYSSGSQEFHGATLSRWTNGLSRSIGSLAALLVVSFASAQAATIYVDQDGRGGSCSDSRTRTNALVVSTPVCSVSRGIAIALAGDTVSVRRARYVLAAPLFLNKVGLQFKAYPSEHPILDFINQPPAISNGIGVGLSAASVLLEGFEIKNSVHECVQTYANNGIIRNNHIHDCGLRPADGRYQNAIQLGETDNILIEGNRIHDSGSHVIYVQGSNVTVRNNFIYRAIAPGGRGSYGIQIGTDGSGTPGKVLARNIKVVHNVIGESANRSGIVLYAPSAVIDTVQIMNNIFFDNARSAILVYDGSSTFAGSIEIKNNIFTGNFGGNCVEFDAGCGTTHGAFTIAGNRILASNAGIKWADPIGHDFHLLAASPAIDTALPGFAVTDADGNVRPQGPASDVGPFEYLVVSSTCRDNDGDGYGNPGSPLCRNGSAVDCNDANASVAPGAQEIVHDQMDNDCNPSTPDNRPPSIAAFTASPASGVAPLTSTLTCSGVDPDGDGLTYTLAFGDGTPSFSGVSTQHIYRTPGTYGATCTITDGFAGSASASRTIVVGGTVIPTLTYEAETFTLSGYAAENVIPVAGLPVFKGIRISASSTTGSAQKSFTGPAATYDVTLTYVGEEDGQPTLTFSIGARVLETFRYELTSSDNNPNRDVWQARTRVYRNVPMATGDLIRLQAQIDGVAWARVDKITFAPPAAGSGSAVAGLQTER